MIRRADLMIDLAQHVRAAHRVGVDACRHRRSGVANTGQLCVDQRKSGWIDRDEPGLIEDPALHVAEVERPVAPQRSADARAELLLIHRQHLMDQGIRGVHDVVSKVAVTVAVQFVRAAARDDAEVAAERASELGLAARCHDLELIDGIHTVRHPAQPRRVVVRREAIDDEVVRHVALAADGQPLSRDGRRFRE